MLKKIRRRLIGDPDNQENELKRWRDYAVKHFGEEHADYQMRCISFSGERLISAPESAIEAHVIPANEELMVVRSTYALIKPK